LLGTRGVEGASAWGRQTAIFLIGRGYDVRDVCPNRTAQHDRARQRGKSDTLDSERIARETLAHALLPKAFKRAGQDAGPDQQAELLAVWWTARCSVIKRRQHLLTESEALLRELPLELVERLPSAKRVRPSGWPRYPISPLPSSSRRPLQQECTCWPAIARRSPISTNRSAKSPASSPSSSHRPARPSASSAGWPPCRWPNCWSRSATPAASPKAASDASTAPRRFAASTAEGPGEPVRHRYNPGGNRRVNAILHRMAVTQLRCEPRAKKIYADARANGKHTSF
jgi:hypothetical protein